MRMPQVLLLAAVWATGTVHAGSCDCEVSQPADALNEAAAVFTGRVVEIDNPAFSLKGVWMWVHDRFADQDDMYCWTSYDDVQNCGLEIEMIVEHSFKGEIGPRVVFRANPPGATYFPYRFQQGERYLVYAWTLPNGSLTTDCCRRTRPLDQAAEDLAFLATVGSPEP